VAQSVVVQTADGAMVRAWQEMALAGAATVWDVVVLPVASVMLALVLALVLAVAELEVVVGFVAWRSCLVGAQAAIAQPHRTGNSRKIGLADRLVIMAIERFWSARACSGAGRLTVDYICTHFVVRYRGRLASPVGD